MTARLPKLETAAFNMSEAARNALLGAKFERVAWFVRDASSEVSSELHHLKALKEISGGSVLTSNGINLRAMAVRISRRSI